MTRRHQAGARTAGLQPEGKGNDDEIGGVAGRAQEGEVVQGDDPPAARRDRGAECFCLADEIVALSRRRESRGAR